MKLVRRRLFWRIYLTLIASLVAATAVMALFLWFLSEASREIAPAGRPGHHRPDVTLYDAGGAVVAARGPPITEGERQEHRHGWGPPHVGRIDLPGGGYALTRYGPPRGVRAGLLLLVMLSVAAGGALAAYPVSALLTRRLEALRAAVALWGEDGTPPALDERGQDEVAALARTFNDAASRLAALLASQKALLANASHELRSPLARLRVAVEMAGLDGAARDEVVRNLGEMNALVEELLLSSRLDHDRSKGAAGADRAGDERRERVDLLGLAAEEAARVGAEASGEAVEIGGDPVLLRRLVRNLLENAAKHGKAPIAIAVARESGGASVAVSDAGRTIAPEQRERIFEPFYRPHGAAEAAGGWGLGLALVRQIAERHGGSVRCDAAPGGGTLFTARLAPAVDPLGS